MPAAARFMHQPPRGHRINQQDRALLQIHILAQRHAEFCRGHNVFRPRATTYFGICGGSGYTSSLEEAGQKSPAGLDDSAAAFKSGHRGERFLEAVEPASKHQVGWIDRRGEYTDQHFARPGPWHRHLDNSTPRYSHTTVFGELFFRTPVGQRIVRARWTRFI